jgi:CPA2 family monovalent cation:H+ antiporter-2
MLSSGGASLAAIGLALAKAAGVMLAAVVLARFVVPRAFARVARTRQRELFLLAVVLVCAGIAWATAQVGLSLALGAFLAGLVLADSEYGHQALSDVLPLRDLFTSLFFVSLGMLLDVGVLLRDPAPVLLLSGGLLLGKLAVVLLVSLLLRLPLRVALLSGAALAQIGEFSFVLAQMGSELGLLSERGRALFLDASVLTMLVTLPLLRLGPHLAAGARLLRPLERAFRAGEPALRSPRKPIAGHVVVLGFGVGGELLAAALRRAGLPHLVIDLDADRVRAARERGEPASYGDATSTEILERAHVSEAVHVAILLNDPEATVRAVRAVRKLAPSVPITARARYLDDVRRLRAAGATRAVAQEVEASLEVVEQVLARAEIGPEHAEAIVAATREGLGRT